MQELERDPPSPSPGWSAPDARPALRLAVVGEGRLGTALAQALSAAGYEVAGPLGRGADALWADAVLLCVPDDQIAPAAQAIADGVIVGHCSGATGLDRLGPREAFSLHPLMTVTREGASFEGAGAAIAGNTARALELARGLAAGLGMVAVEISDAERATYHAAASIASNFLVTLEGAAERLAHEVGVARELLVPLVRASVENWAILGPELALTGPIARGDEATVEAHRLAIAEHAPELIDLYDALAAATRALAGKALAGNVRAGAR